MNQVLIGTSGYDHPELKGSFYPADLARKDFLAYYATRFNALELNSTFYGMPDSKRMLSFFERTQGRIKFSIKANRLLTHEITGAWKEAAAQFADALHPLLEKDVLSSILLQFPESFHYIPENRVYLSNILKALDEFPKVVEFRHREWIRPSVFEGLTDRGTGIVFCDMPQLKNLPDGNAAQTPFLAQHAYIRFHGRNEAGWYVSGTSSTETPRYDYEYSENELKAFIPMIKKAQSEGKTVQLYFNNHPKGTGTKNALQIKSFLQ